MTLIRVLNVLFVALLCMEKCSGAQKAGNNSDQAAFDAKLNQYHDLPDKTLTIDEPVDLPKMSDPSIDIVKRSPQQPTATPSSNKYRHSFDT
ncbi:MAG: hypothetical protein M1831_007089 [Alyxoria varia]|nr:MAG: hypothetical protein M1831_007089 [Alyxoria varia]